MYPYVSVHVPLCVKDNLIRTQRPRPLCHCLFLHLRYTASLVVLSLLIAPKGRREQYVVQSGFSFPPNPLHPFNSTG